MCYIYSCLVYIINGFFLLMRYIDSLASNQDNVTHGMCSDVCNLH